MSLINQMLTDLERRHARDSAAETELPKTVRAPERRPGSTARLRLLFLLLGSVALIGAWSAIPRLLRHTGEPLSAQVRVPERSQAVLSPTAPAKPLEIPPAIAAPFSSSTAMALSDPSPSTGAFPGADDMPSPPAAKPEAAASASASDRRPEATRGTQVAAEEAVKAASLPDPEAAAPAMSRVLRDPTPAEAADGAVQEARAALAGGRLGEAESALRRALILAPEHLAARESLVDCLLGQGRGSETEPLLEEGMRLVPAHLPFAKRFARQLAGRGDWPQADQVLRRAPSPTVVDDPEFHALAAAVAQQRGDFATAAERYRQLLQLRPTEGAWWIGLGIALEGEGHQAEALESYQRGLAGASLNPELSRYARERLAALGR